MKASFLICGISVALAASTVRASDTDTPREARIGVGTGVVVGALAGGPLGAVVGAGLGAWIGDKFHDGKELPAVEEERDLAQSSLDRTRLELGSTRATLARTQTQVRDLEQSLTSRDSELAALTEARAAELGQGLEVDVMFRTGQSTLPDDLTQRLGELASVLASNPQLRVHLDGHADPRGGDDYNRSLSDARMQAVRNALVAGGVDASRIEATAHGESASLAKDGDLDAYALERRVRIRLGLDAAPPEGTTATAVADSK
jgi:outer membrane protein OmpA-like peptidoglycan-associated protein